MRSSFNSSSPNSHSFGVYSPSPLGRNAPSSISSSSRFEFSPSLSYRDSIPNRDHAIKDSDGAYDPSAGSSRRTFSRPSEVIKPAIGNIGSARMALDDETNTLLERYGVRKSTTTETPAQSFLKQRRLQQLEQDSGWSGTRRKSDTVVNETAAVSGDLPSSSSSRLPDRKDSTRSMNTTAQDITQAEYINRLLAAHNRVDELLRSRGLSAEDESKYLKAWEEISIVKAERYQRVRTPSNSSDSGLSTDGDSDRSDAEAVKMAEIVCDQMFTKPDATTDCSRTFRLRATSLHTSLSCKPSKSKKFSAVFFLARSPSNIPIFGTLKSKRTTKFSVKFACKAAAYAHKSTSQAIYKSKVESMATRKVVRSAKKGEKISAKFQAPSSKRPSAEKQPVNVKRQRFYIKQQKEVGDVKTSPAPSTAEQLRTVLASLKRKPTKTASSSAEISIQHCSFYQVSHRAVEKVEKNVRINLRLTERAPNKYTTAVVLPTATRPQFAYFSVPMSRPSKDRSNSIQIEKPKRVVGTLYRSKTLDVPKEEKHERKINRVVIPEYFLQGSDYTEDLKHARERLKSVRPQAGGEPAVADMPKPKLLKRSNAIKRKPLPEVRVDEGCSKENKIPKVDSPPNLPKTERLPTAEKPLRLTASKSSPSLQRNRSVQSPEPVDPAGLLNDTTTSGELTTCCSESKAAELSPTDRLLVEQFRQTIHIPRPVALKQRALLTFRAVSPRPRLQRPTSEVEFIRCRTPQRLSPQHRSPQPRRNSTPPSLKKAYRSLKQFSKREQLLNSPPLKKVDREIARLRDKLKIPPPERWIPRWRNSCEKDVVERMEEEQEHEDKEEDSALAADTKRIAPKSNHDNKNPVAEGEKEIFIKNPVRLQCNKFRGYDEIGSVKKLLEKEEQKKQRQKQDCRRDERNSEQSEQSAVRERKEDCSSKNECQQAVKGEKIALRRDIKK